MGYFGQPSIFATIAKGIFIAVLAYGAFPTIFAICKPKINVKSYHWICFLVNFVVYLCFAFIGGNYNAAPYLLWTLAFCFIFKRFLPEIEPPIDYSKMEKKSFEEVFSSVPEEVLERCGSQRGSREGITRVAESFAKDGKIPLEYVPVLVDEYMKPVNTVAKKQTKEEPVMEVEKESGVCYCRFCGAKIAEGDKFCCSCGAELNSATAPKRKHQKAGAERSTDYRPFIAIGAIALLILVALIVIIIMLANSERSMPMSAQSENSIQTPVPTVISTPEPTPDEPENTIILFPSPEQNGVEWPENMSWTFTPWSGENNGAESWPQYYSAKAAIEQAIQDSGLGSEEKDTYAVAYMAARANGENDIEAHITALTTTDVDKYFLGKKEYTEYIYNSALESGMSEYDVKQLSNQIGNTWNWAWRTYTDARSERAHSHAQAVDSVIWTCFRDPWMDGFTGSSNRYSAYLDLGFSVDEASAKIKEEQEELFRLLKEYYEGPGLDVDNISIGTGYSISVREKEPTSGANTRDAGLNAYLNSLSDAKT